MLVLDKKRLSLTFLIVVLGIFTFSYQDAKEDLEKTLITTATPVSGKVVILDAGHGSPDVGVILLGKMEIRII